MDKEAGGFGRRFGESPGERVVEKALIAVQVQEMLSEARDGGPHKPRLGY